MALGNNIFVESGSFTQGSADHIGLLGHELVHTGQWRNEGLSMAFKYFFDMGKYENPANTKYNQITKDLLPREPICPPCAE